MKHNLAMRCGWNIAKTSEQLFWLLLQQIVVNVTRVACLSVSCRWSTFLLTSVLLSCWSALCWHLLFKFLSLYHGSVCVFSALHVKLAAWIRAAGWDFDGTLWKKHLVWPPPFAYVRPVGSHVHSKNVGSSFFGSALINLILHDCNSN